MKKSKASIILNVIAITLSLLAIAATIFVGTNFELSRDFIQSLSYQPAEGMDKIEKSLDLTYRGSLVFKASNPELKTGQEYNDFCESHNASISILGCYKNEKILVYKIESRELDGIIESTTAHEMMHAIWRRLPDSEKESLTKILKEEYEKNKTVLSIMEEYSEQVEADELFARIGTEIHEIAPELEKVYATYFEDRQKIVDYHDKYINVFNELSKKIKQLSTEMDSLKKTIDEKVNNYTNRSEELKVKIDEFNQCAETTDCYSYYTFNTKRSELQSEKNALDDIYNEITGMTDSYNKKVEEYNSNALKTIYYTSITNSNIERNE